MSQTNEKKVEFNLKNHITEVVAGFSATTNRFNIKTMINCNENLYIYSLVDSYTLIIANLITNSISHAYDKDNFGIITIDVSIIKKNTLQFIYKDDGKGISEENMKKIFVIGIFSNTFK